MSQINVRNLSNENEDGAPDIVGVSTFSATSYFVPPVGNTAQRPQNSQPGDLRFNTDSASLEYYRGDTLGWSHIEMTSPDLGGGTGSNAGTGARGIFFGGYQAPAGRTNAIQYITIPTLGDATNFGTLDDNTGRPSAGASKTRAVCIGGFQSPALSDTIQYVTISSTGNATDFGNLTYARNQAGAASSQVRAIGGGGNPSTVTMDYITIASTGDAKDFGNLTTARQSPSAAASSTRMLWMSGETTEVIDYVTISSTGNALDFGNMHQQTRLAAACSNSIRALYAGGDHPSLSPHTDMIQEIIIATKGDTTDFGNLTLSRTELTSCSSPTRAIFAGGHAPSTPLDRIDYVQFGSAAHAIDFGNLETATSYRPGGTSNAHGGL